MKVTGRTKRYVLSKAVELFNYKDNDADIIEYSVLADGTHVAELISVAEVAARVSGGLPAPPASASPDSYTDTSYTEYYYYGDGAIQGGFVTKSLNFYNIANWNGYTGNIADFNEPVNSFDVSSYTYFDRVFSYATSFNQPLDQWDTSSATVFRFLFDNAHSFNQDIGGWNVSNVTIMSFVFSNATSFNQDISAWDVSNVSIMQNMFSGADAFNQNISTWDVSSVIDMSSMFSSADAFNQDISSWNVSNVVNMDYMFSYTGAFNQDISSWNTSSVQRMVSAFNQATSFDQNLGSWNISVLRHANNMFSNSGMSPLNYSNTLIGWANQVPNIQSNVVLGASNINYYGWSATLAIGRPETWMTELQDGGPDGYTDLLDSEKARAILTGDYGWTIIDSGSVEPDLTYRETVSSVTDFYGNITSTTFVDYYWENAIGIDNLL